MWVGEERKSLYLLIFSVNLKLLLKRKNKQTNKNPSDLWHRAQASTFWSKSLDISNDICTVCVYSVVSNSLHPPGLCPVRPLCPWNFPGKKTYSQRSWQTVHPGSKPDHSEAYSLPQEGPRDRFRMKAFYLLIMAQSNEERSSGDVASNQQKLQGLQDCLGDRRTMGEEKGILSKRWYQGLRDIQQLPTGLGCDGFLLGRTH